MRTRLILLALFGAAVCPGQYVYDYECVWANENTGSCSLYNSGFGVAILYSSPVSGNPNDYEVKSQLAIKQGGENYIQFLRAGLSTYEPGTGSYISAELAVPANFQTTGPATLNINQCVNGSVTQLASTAVTATDGMTFRTVIWGSNLWVYLNNILVLMQTVPVTAGSPGVGGGAYGANFQVGHHDTVPPNKISARSVATSLLPNAASLKWESVLDDPIGIGVYQYSLARNGVPMATSPTDKSLTDTNVSPSTTYTYTLQAMDYHGNLNMPTTVTVTTPPATAVDPRRIGIYSTGSYWGGGGEQIDTLSGNVNFSVPLVTPLGRAGWSTPVGLSYNSQNWRQDNGVNWMLGSDVGYGFGWRLAIGSITPFYTTTWSGVDHYVYTDSTGAEYRLDQNNNGIWSSTQGIYVWFDANANTLHFKDGHFQVMGGISGGAEPDAGTMYPTIIEDVSGNQVLISYEAGSGLAGQPNSSARINLIEDVRAPQCMSPQSYVANTVNCPTYTFSYNGDTPTPHLISIVNYLSTSENYNLAYNSNVAVEPPFGTDPSFSGMSTAQLASVNVVSANQYQFTYDAAGAQELTQVTFPFGGHLRWSYATDAFTGPRLQRAVGTRYLAADSAGATEWSYPFTRDNAAAATLHSWTSLVDASGVGSKTWNFITGSGAPAWQLGLSSELVQKNSLNGSAILQDDTYTWSREPIAGNIYISAKTTVRDEGSSNQQSALTTQAIDQYGNVTQSNVYPYNNTTNPLRTYNNTYLNDSTHTSHYIFDRLSTSTLTTGGATKTLVQNTYDASGSVTVNGQSFSYGDIDLFYPATREIDPTPPASWGSQGIVVSTTTPVHTVWFQAAHGAVAAAAPTDGQTVTMTPGSGTNYAAAAPQTIATETFSQNVAYNAWLGTTQTTDINGQTLSMTYDSIGRPATSSNAWVANTTLPPTYTYTYSAQNVTPVTQTKTGPDGVTTTTLDGLGRVIRVSRGDSNGPQSYTDTVYSPCACSPLGKLQQVSQPYVPNGSPAWTVYTYDGLGRTVTLRRPDGASTTSYAYSGSQTTVTDPGTTIDPVSGNAVPIWKTMTSDALGNLTTVSEPDPANPTTATLTTTYTYDWMNHVTQVSMPRSGTTQTRTFVYSDAGLLTSATNPENGTVLYYYNADNTLKYKHDTKGQETVYAYDTYKRVQWIYRFPTGQSNPEDTCQRTWYLYGDQSGVAANYGRLWTITHFANNSAGTQCLTGATATSWTGLSGTQYSEVYNYWPSGQIWNKTLGIYRSGIGAETIAQVNYYYYVSGSLDAISVPTALPFGQTGTSNTWFIYNYDSMGRPVSMSGPAPDGSNATATWVQGVQYDPASRMTQLQYMAGATGSTPIYTTETMSYNTNGQMVSQNWSTPSSLGPTGGLAYSYAAGQNNGQITQVSDTISGETIVYKYDALKRLTSSSSTPQSGSSTTPWTQNFQFDGFGNLTAKALNGTTTPIGVNASTNQLSSASYDLNGNMTSGAGATLTYDTSNRMTSAAEVSGGTEYYSYSADNKRIYKLEANGTEEWTFYGGYGEKLGVFQYSASAGVFNPVRSTVSFAGRTILSDGFPVFQDRVGTNRASGARFYPYGDEITSTSNDREKFATYTRDSYTGLDYADHRMYASTYGRFNTPDPSKASGGPSDPGSWNRYAYTRGDPVNRADPRGLDDCDADICVDVWGWSWGGPFEGLSPAQLEYCLAQMEECLGQAGQAQGGGSPYAAHITALIAPGTSQNQDQALQAALDDAWAHIVSSPTCASFLTGNSAPGSYVANLTQLANVLSNTTYIFGPTDPGAAAQVNALGGNQVTIAPSGAFFATPGGAGSVQVFGPNSTDTGRVMDTFASQVLNQAEILLHELGHETGVLGYDAGPGTPVGANYFNNQAVLDNCFTKNAQGVYQ